MSRAHASAGARFVVVEGIECSGKSTLLAALAHRLRAGGYTVVLTREPGGSPLGEALRTLVLDRADAVDARAEALLMNAARAQHVAETIRPALAAGATVLCDRFIDSTLAYQGYGRGVDIGTLRAVNAAATGGLEPNLTLLLDVPVRVSRERMRLRAGAADRFEREDDAFHERVRDGYLELAAESAHVVLDGTLAPQEIYEHAMQALHAATVHAHA